VISILIPHLREPRSDDALRICLDCIVANTDVDYEIILKAVEKPQGVYAAYNDMAKRAAGQWILIMNNDMFLAPGWAKPMLEAAEWDAIVAGVLVECGAICPSQMNIRADWGMLPESYRRAEFEEWAKTATGMPGGTGHHAPALFEQMEFVRLGGYNTKLGEYPHTCLDQELWERLKIASYKFKRVRSYCYHLQSWSLPVEQKKRSRQVV